MQRIRQSVFDLARLFLPVCRIGKPAGPVGDEGPGADLGNAVRQRVDVAIGGIGAAHLLGHVVLVDMAAPGEIDDTSRRSGRHAAPARSCGSRAARRLPTAAPRARGRSARSRISASRDRCSSACASTAGSARVRPSTGAGVSIERFSASRLEKSNVAVRHCSTFTGSKSWRLDLVRPVPRRADRPGR